MGNVFSIENHIRNTLIMGILSFAVTVFWRQEYDEYQYIPRQ